MIAARTRGDEEKHAEMQVPPDCRTAAEKEARSGSRGRARAKHEEEESRGQNDGKKEPQIRQHGAALSAAAKSKENGTHVVQTLRRRPVLCSACSLSSFFLFAETQMRVSPPTPPSSASSVERRVEERERVLVRRRHTRLIAENECRV